MAIDVKATLVRQRTDILEQLVALAVKDRSPGVVEKFRIEGDSLIKSLLDTEKAIDALQSPKALDLAGCESAIDAIELLLRSIDRPISAADVIRRAIEGGLWGGKPGTGLRVQKSLTMHLKPDAGPKLAGRIKEVNGLVGLSQWDSARFKPSL